MWKPLLALLALCVTSLPANAKNHGDWTSVERLSFEAPVRVELWSGEEYAGRFHSADAQHLRMKVRDANRYGAIVRREFNRDEVRVLEVLGGHVDPYNYLRTGQIMGGVAGATAVGIAAGRAWPIGVLAGAAGGAILGTMVGGAVGLVAETSHRRRKIVYEAPAATKLPHAPVF